MLIIKTATLLIDFQDCHGLGCWGKSTESCFWIVSLRWWQRLWSSVCIPSLSEIIGKILQSFWVDTPACQGWKTKQACRVHVRCSVGGSGFFAWYYPVYKDSWSSRREYAVFGRRIGKYNFSSSLMLNNFATRDLLDLFSISQLHLPSIALFSCSVGLRCIDTVRKIGCTHHKQLTLITTRLLMQTVADSSLERASSSELQYYHDTRCLRQYSKLTVS